MSLSGSKGFLGIATQGPTPTDMVTAPHESAFEYVEVTTAPFRVADVTRVRRPTIGASPLGRNAYKVGTSVAAQVGFEVTPNILGKFLYLLMGHADNPAALGDAFKHTLRMNPADQYSVPYFALRRGVADQILEQALGCKARRAVLAFPAGDAVQAQLEILGRVPGFASAPVEEAEIETLTFAAATDHGSFSLLTQYGATAPIPWDATPATTASNIAAALNLIFGPGATSVTGPGPFTVTWASDGPQVKLAVADNLLLDVSEAGVPAPVIAQATRGSGLGYDTTPILTVVNDASDLFIETAQGVYEGSQDGVISLGASIEWTNLLTDPTRYRIGSPYPIDYTLLDRDATVTLNMEIDNPDLYRKVYYAGGTVWDPTPWVGGFKVKAASAEKPFTNGGPLGYSLEVLANSLNFQAMLVANEPQKVVEAQLTAQLLKSQVSGVEALQFDIVTDRAVPFR